MMKALKERNITCHFLIKSVAFIVFTWMLCDSANASTITWTGAGGFLGSGNWSTASNWSTNSVPTSSDDVVFDDIALGYTVKLTAAVTVKSISINSALAVILPVKINTNGYALNVTNGLNVGGISILFPTALTFSGSGTVTLSSAVTAYASANLTFETGSNIIISSATVTSYSSSTISNAGTVTANSTNFNVSGSSSTITNSGTFNLGTASIIYLTGTSASVSNSGTFNLLSDASGTAAIGAISSGSSGFSGQYNVQRYVTGGNTVAAGRYVYRGYRLMASPVHAGTVSGKYPSTLNYLAASAIVSGAKSSYGTLSGNPTIYLYSEDYAPSNASFTGGNFKGVTDISNLSSPYTVSVTSNSTKSLYVGNGFMFFFRGDNVHSVGTSPGKTTYPYVAPESVVFTASGLLNQGSYTVNNWQTGSGLLYTSVSGNSAIKGFNLIGNPYPSTIDWEATNSAGIVTTNIDPTIYVLDPLTYQYNSYSASTHTGNAVSFSGKIASGQGFFVKATGSSPSMVFTEAAKSPTTVINGASGNLMMGTPEQATVPRQLFRLRLAIDSISYDDIVIGFSSNAVSGYNLWEDSKYLAGMNAAEGLASLSADTVPVPLSINFLPLPKQQAEVIRLRVTAANSGRLSLNKLQLDSLPRIYEMWLMDRYKKDSLDIRNNSVYAFDIDKSDTASFGENRFTLVIRQNQALGVHLLDFTAVKKASEVSLNWLAENEENYTNFTVERSIDNGLSFNVLGGFASNSQRTYTFSDTNPIGGTNLYRLKTEDLNGTVSYSKIIAVSYGASTTIAAEKVNVYPNPAVNVLNLKINQAQNNYLSQSQLHLNGLNVPSAPANAYAIRIVNTSGTVIRSELSAQAEWQTDISTLMPGTYIVQVMNNSDKSMVGRTTFVKM
ncbi:MAG TPA: T9SS type A sorting domain-containing protein [Mucilaginibacter sp.]|nr:T9SS type A sorting domain-containing protein [Mucilaginibacter sp.]